MNRTQIGSGLLSIALVILCTRSVDGQPGPSGTPAANSSVKIVEDPTWRHVINVARDCIQDKEYNQAIEVLQKALGETKDYYVQITESDPGDPKKEITRWASVKFEANRLIGSMPPKALEDYELTHGAVARKLLDAAKKKKDPVLVAEVAQRFRHTKAGSEAHDTVLKAFKAGAPTEVVNLKDWPSWRGNLTNTGQAMGGPPLLDKRLWSRPLFNDVLDGFKEKDLDEPAEARIKTAIKQVNDLKQAVLPGSFPIAARDIMVYRNHRGILAVALKEIAIKDEETGVVSKYPPGHIIWKSMPMDRSLAMLLEKAKTRAKTEQWLDAFEKVPGFTSFLFDNTLLGTLATDQGNIYVINDLAVPPHPGVFKMSPFDPQIPKLGDMKNLLIQNELYAYDLITGKLKWDLNQEDKDFKDSHFLSLPITIAGKLYILNEKLTETPQVPKQFGNGLIHPIPGESELRLICLDPTKIVIASGSPKPTIVAPIQALASVKQQNRMVQDVGRRVNAVQLAYSDGVLICPTNAGEVFGIDLRTRSLTWSYPYRESPHQQIVLPGMPQPKGNAGTTVISKWRSAPPAIQAGKVVFTAPDADSVHCVNLHDGRLVWKKGQQKGDLYLAGVFDGRVLIVGDTTIRALDLKDGRPLWSITTGDLASGQGAASKGIYYLPLKGEILAVDLVKGEIKAHHRVPAGAGAPGNIVFYADMMLSQTPTEVMAFPQAAR